MRWFYPVFVGMENLGKSKGKSIEANGALGDLNHVNDTSDNLRKGKW